MSTVYIETTPTNCTIDGEHGQVTAIVRDLAPRRTPRAAFVHLDMGDMVYATLGEASGDRGQWCEVRSFRRIDRDEFDRLNELDTLRSELGWRS